MRTIPGMMVINPCDAVEARAAVEAAILHNGPVYLRFGRFAVPVLNDKETYKFEPGKGVTLRDGEDLTIVASGLTVSIAMEAAELLQKDGISARVLNIHTIKPLDTEIIARAARETGAILTVEEHSIIGGLGAAVCEAVCESCPVPVLRFGMMDEFGRSGRAAKLLEMYGFTAENFAALAKKAVGLKK